MKYRTGLCNMEVIECFQGLEINDVVMIARSDPTGYCYETFWKISNIERNDPEYADLELIPLDYKMAKIVKK